MFVGISIVFLLVVFKQMVSNAEHFQDFSSNIFQNASPSAWSIAISMPDGSKRIIHLPGTVSESDEDVKEMPKQKSLFDVIFSFFLSFGQNKNDSCRNCFRIKTVDSGRRMLAQSCADENCVPLINSTVRREPTKPTSTYDFSECGQTFSFSPSPIVKSIQLKISTSIKNVLRPAEYPWIVRSKYPIQNYKESSTQFFVYL